MKDIFTAEDFVTDVTPYEMRLSSGLTFNEGYRDVMCELANRKLSELISTWPKVYSWGEQSAWYDKPNNFGNATHVGLVAFIEEIPKAECEHEPLNPRALAVPVVCKHCSRRLKAKWGLAE